MSLNNIRAVGDDRQWKDEVERELKSVLDVLKYGKISLRAASATTGGGGGSSGAGADSITATLPATYDAVTYVVGVDQDAFDHISNLDYAQFDTTVATGTFNDVGLLTWNDTDGTLEFGLKGGLVTLQIGQEQVVRVRNNTGSTLTEGTVCYFSSSNGTNFNVTPAIASSDATSAQTMGVLTETLNTSSTQHGFLTTFGLVRHIDLSYIAGLADGDQLYLDGTTAGRMTKTKPAAPTHLVYVGICLSAAGGGSNSSIFVKVQNGYELDEIHDVKITTPVADNEVLAYTLATDLWENKTAAEASLLTTSATLDSLADVVITTPATDQVLKYNGANWVNATSPGGGGGTVTSISAGTGLSASPSSPITTSGTLSLADIVVSDKSANYTIVSTDQNTIIRSTGSAITITLANVLTVGQSIQFIQAGAGQITFAAGAGVTLSSTEPGVSVRTTEQYAVVSVICGASGIYYLTGDLIATSIPLQILLIAGGGSGAKRDNNGGNATGVSGGGGAGGMFEVTSGSYYFTPGQTYSLVVGAGGAGVSGGGTSGNTGSNSTIQYHIVDGDTGTKTTKTVYGGGFGDDNSTGGNGGSGGGAGWNGTSTSSGGTATTVGEGNAGGATTSTSGSAKYGAGGGGATAAGGNQTTLVAGNGGNGKASVITGTTYAGGGGGANGSSVGGGTGGTGGGTAGAYSNTTQTSVAANTGSGSGGLNSPNSNAAASGSGGSGIAAIKYPDSYPALTVDPSASAIVTVTGGYRTYIFTGSVTIGV